MTNKKPVDWTMTSFTGATFDHTRRFAEMSGDELLLEFDYLRSGAADEIDKVKGVRLGLKPDLSVRLQKLGNYISTSCPLAILPVPA